MKESLADEMSGEFFKATLTGLSDAATGLDTAADGAKQMAQGGTMPWMAPPP